MNVTVFTIDSATKLPPEAKGGVVVTGSHGAIYAAYLSAKAGVRAAIHHDAGIGFEEAGVGGLPYAEALGLAMAAVATESARIGDAADLLARGVISRANVPAAACGVVAGMGCREAVERLKQAPGPTGRHRPRPKADTRSTASCVSIQPRCWDRTTVIASPPPAATAR